MTTDTQPHMRASVVVPAKVNLFLGVGDLRSDGYHEVVTILQTVGVFDTVELVVAGEFPRELGDCPDRVALAFEHDGTEGVPLDAGNLVLRAAERLLDELGVETVEPGPDIPMLRLRLGKTIPVAAGMAGGSADAAAALVALNAILCSGLDRHRLRDIAADLGADVPFCVTGGTALATGTGTATADVMCRGVFHWVLGMSDRPLATPVVYRAFDRLDHHFSADHRQVLQAVRTGDAVLLGQSLHNDLQAAAFQLRPELADAVDAFLVDGALGAIVSGSGPTVLALAEDPDHARALQEAARDRFDRVEVASSPAGGPQLRLG